MSSAHFSSEINRGGRRRVVAGRQPGSGRAPRVLRLGDASTTKPASPKGPRQARLASAFADISCGRPSRRTACPLGGMETCWCGSRRHGGMGRATSPFSRWSYSKSSPRSFRAPTSTSSSITACSLRTRSGVARSWTSGGHKLRRHHPQPFRRRSSTRS